MNIVNVADTSLYKEFLAMKEEVMKHKWYESEKAGHDIGFAKALIGWTLNFKSEWIRRRKNKK
jgi:hypothetical protein